MHNIPTTTYKNADTDGPDYQKLVVSSLKRDGFVYISPESVATIALNEEQVRDLIQLLQRAVGDSAGNPLIVRG